MDDRTPEERDPDTGQFVKGKIGGPGRPKGSRNKLGEQFLRDLAAQWEEDGPQTIKEAREKDPVAFIRVIASLLPKELLVRQEPLGDLTDDEIADRLDALEETLGLIAASRGTGGDPRPTHRGTGKA